MFSANSAIEEIKEKVSIEEVVSQVVPLKKAGRTLKGLCPFHSEKTPSFIVFPDKGNFHCFGCGANGDIFGFVMRSQNVGFGEALKLLAEKAGVTLPTRRAEAVEGQHRSHLFEINDAAARYFHNLLLNADAAKIAREYLHKRAIDADTIEAFQLGYSLNSWQSLTDYLVNKGYDLAEIVEAGLAIEREGGGQYDRFRGRLIFPIRDSRGNVTGFGGRALDDSQPKYLNSPQTPVFDKSASLYGIDLAGAAIRREDKVVVVEGYFDAVVSHQCGMKNVVASLGTALTEKQVGALKRLTKKLVLALDPDAAGDEATLRGLEVAKQVFDKKVVPVPSWSGLIRYEYKLDADIRIITLPRGQDPDEVIRENPEEWRWSIEHALPIVDYYFSSVSSSLDLTQAKDKSKAAERLLPIIKELPDKVEQAHYVQKLAQMVQVSEKTIELSLSRAQTPRPTGPRAKNEPQSEERVSTSIEEYCLILMLVYPEVRDLVERIDENWMSDTLIREMLSSMRSCFSTEEPFDLDRFREGLEPILQECFDRLQRIATSEPPVSGKSVAREFEDTARDLERSHLHEQLSRLRFYYSCLTETQDREGEKELNEKMKTLITQLEPLEHGDVTARHWKSVTAL